MPRYFGILQIISTASLAWLTVASAQAAQEIVLINDQTQVVTLAETPSTVIIGNPSIADVTTEGRMLFFQPRGFGVTNVIALDPDGKKLGEYLVTIVYDDHYSVSMYSPGGRATLNCRKDCETTMRVGDSMAHFDLYNSQVGGKYSLAKTQATGEDPPSTNEPGVANVVIAPQ